MHSCEPTGSQRLDSWLTASTTDPQVVSQWRIASPSLSVRGWVYRTNGSRDGSSFPGWMSSLACSSSLGMLSLSCSLGACPGGKKSAAICSRSVKEKRTKKDKGHSEECTETGLFMGVDSWRWHCKDLFPLWLVPTHLLRSFCLFV